MCLAKHGVSSDAYCVFLVDCAMRDVSHVAYVISSAKTMLLYFRLWQIFFFFVLLISIDCKHWRTSLLTEVWFVFDFTLGAIFGMRCKKKEK